MLGEPGLLPELEEEGPQEEGPQSWRPSKEYSAGGLPGGGALLASGDLHASPGGLVSFLKGLAFHNDFRR